MPAPKLPRAAVSLLTPERLRHAGGAMRIDWSCDGRKLATISFDQRLAIWDAETGEALHFFGISDPFVEGLAFSPDSTRVASGKKSVSVFDLDTGKRALSLKGHKDTVHDIHWSPDGALIATASSDGTARLWDAASGAQVASFAGESATAVRFSPDGEWLLVGRDGELTLCRREDGHVLARCPVGGWKGLMRIDFLPDGSRVVAQGHDKREVLLLDGASLEQVGQMEVDHWLRSVAASPCGRWIAYCGGGRYASDHPHAIPGRSIHSPHVYIWDVHAGEVILRLRGHAELMQDVAFAPDGSAVASCSSDHTIRAWSLPSGEPLLVPAPGFEEEPRSLAWRSAEEVVATGQTETLLWEARAGAVRASMGKGFDSIVSLPDGRLAGFGWSGSGIWRVQDGTFREDLRLELPKDREEAARYLGRLSPDGEVLYGLGRDVVVRAWDVRTGAEVRSWRLPRKEPTAARLSPDGRRLAVASITHRTLWLIDTTGRHVDLLAEIPEPGHGSNAHVLDLAWAADGRRLWILTNGGQLWRADLATDALECLNPGFCEGGSWGYSHQPTDCLALSPDGRWLAAGLPNTRDRHVYLLSAEDGAVRQRLSGHGHPVSVLAFSPDGALLATMDAKGRRAMVWEVSRLKL